MVLGFYLAATLIIVLILSYLPKRLHLLELWFNAIVHVYLYTYQFSILTNLKLVSLPESLDKTAASVAVRFILFPVIVLLFLQLYVRWRQRSRTAAFAALFLFGTLLIVAQPLFQRTGIMLFTRAGIYWSALAWFILLEIQLLCMIAFRSLIRKELLLP